MNIQGRIIQYLAYTVRFSFFFKGTFSRSKNFLLLLVLSYNHIYIYDVSLKHWFVKIQMIFHFKLLLKYDTCIHAHTCIHAYEYICKVCKGYMWKDI